MTTIETREQAYDLPAGTVLRLATGRVADRTPDGWTITGIYSHSVIPRGLYDTDLPAVVLHDSTQPAPAGVIDREAVDAVLKEHTIECTGPGEVTCRGCRHAGWMSWTVYRSHVTDAVLAVLPGLPLAQVKADALREAAATARAYSNGNHDNARHVASILDERADGLEREDRR